MEGFIDDHLYQMVKKIKDCDEFCNICTADETKAGKKWLRYMLSCGHIYHAKCIRKHCFEKMIICCPRCGYIKPVNINKYCFDCDSFGHPTKECKKKNLIQHSINQIKHNQTILFEESNF